MAIVQISFVPTRPKTETIVQISSISTIHKSGLLFGYPLFWPSLRPTLLFRYHLFLLGKNQDCNSDILCLYLAKIGTTVQISFVPTRAKTWTSIQKSFVSTWQKSGLHFRYLLFWPSLTPTLPFRYPLFQHGENQDCYSDILYFYLTQIETLFR